MFDVYKERAEQLSGARQLIHDEPAYTSAIALLAIHSALSLNDALQIKLTGSPYKGQDHMEAVRKTEKSCKAKSIDTSGIKQLRKLITHKTAVSYGDEQTSFDTATVLLIASERFEAWAYKRLQEVI